MDGCTCGGVIGHREVSEVPKACCGDSACQGCVQLGWVGKAYLIV